MSDTLSELFKVIVSRRLADPEHSYVASLHQAGLDKILEKVGEESIELILAAKNHGPDDARDRLISEMADLWFHTLVLLAHNNLTPEAVLTELQRREGTSGIEEKKSRPLTSAE
jgi:phosphoribosyl-ATP pyrophosphohydrolase